MTDMLKMLPGDVPDEVIGFADEALNTTHYSSDPLDQTVACARAIMAERERCAMLALTVVAGCNETWQRAGDAIAAAIRKGEA